jgi:tRNA(Arg) A34 adenosine deaminase TadA
MADTEITATDVEFLRASFAVAARSRAHGNHPFGAVVVDDAGRIVLEQENAFTSEHDMLGHAELLIARQAWRLFGSEALGDYTLYTSAEPCAMCSGGIYWSGIGRVVYGLAERTLLELTGDNPENPTMSVDCRGILNGGQREVAVAGPALEEEAFTAHEGFWN